MSLGTVTPILRFFDEARTREFYLDFLGFDVDWEHRFEDGLPLYLQVSKDGCDPSSNRLTFFNRSPGISA